MDVRSWHPARDIYRGLQVHGHDAHPVYWRATLVALKKMS